MTTQSFKTLKWFSLEWDNIWNCLFLSIKSVKTPNSCFKDIVWNGNQNEIQQAFDWLEANGYIERIKE